MACGKTADRRIAELTAEYVSRLGHYCSFSYSELPAVKGAADERTQKEKEGAKILASVAPGDFLALFDEGGREYSSAEFASLIEGYGLRGIKRVVFAIGGPYGFSPAVYERADAKISLSRMTFSHQMVRLFAAEQLYRAYTIIKGEKYHHA